MAQQPSSSSTSVVQASDGPFNIKNYTVRVSDSFARQNNATPYSIGDVICEMVGDTPAPVPLSFVVGRVTGGTVTIFRAQVITEVEETTIPGLLLYLFTVTPAGLQDDNAAFNVALTNLVGVMPLAGGYANDAGTIWQSAAGEALVAVCAVESQTLYGVLVASAAWTPTASQTLIVTLSAYQD